MGYEELDITGCPQVSEAGATEMADEAYVGYEGARNDDEHEWGGPGWDLVRADTSRISRMEA